jgi:GNAT superfamily N-acetyltransferase
MFMITQATHADRAQIRDLFFEYLDWVNGTNSQLIGFSFDVAALVDKNMNELDVFMPPSGRLMMAWVDGAAAGCACMHSLQQHIVELKRMYVRPMYRRKGIGGALVDEVISESRVIGCKRIRLDSARFMSDAHVLYRSKGFKEIEAYPESEIPEQVRQHWIFMELPL